MRHLVCISALVAMAAIALGQAASSQAKAPAADKGSAAKKVTATPAATSWTQPKTPWGDPDVQGTWTSDDCIGTPLNRPANLGDRLYYTEQELATRQANLERQLQNDLVETVAPDARVSTGPPGHWGERARRPCKQTSLVIDPPNGHVPDMLPEAKLRPVPEGAGNNNPKTASSHLLNRITTIR